ncbi:MAG: hypothetical protein KAF91_03755 [Nostoc sp. TH1S01]|nr:hypothetical protein [Nostoc sp. TH1S01]
MINEDLDNPPLLGITTFTDDLDGSNSPRHQPTLFPVPFKVRTQAAQYL